jgi:hypothetical protein
MLLMPQPISLIHLVPAVLLYAGTLAIVDLDHIFNIEEEVEGLASVIYTLQLGAALLLFFLGRYVSYIPSEELGLYMPRFLSFLEVPFRKTWPYLVFAVRVWLLAGFEVGSITMIVVQMSAGGIDAQTPVMAAGTILLATLHLLYERLTSPRSFNF